QSVYVPPAHIEVRRSHDRAIFGADHHQGVVSLVAVPTVQPQMGYGNRFPAELDRHSEGAVFDRLPSPRFYDGGDIRNLSCGGVIFEIQGTIGLSRSPIKPIQTVPRVLVDAGIDGCYRGA